MFVVEQFALLQAIFIELLLAMMKSDLKRVEPIDKYIWGVFLDLLNLFGLI